MKNEFLFLLDDLYEKVNSVEGVMVLLSLIAVYLAFRFAHLMPWM